jgi:hypothetical protein
MEAQRSIIDTKRKLLSDRMRMAGVTDNPRRGGGLVVMPGRGDRRGGTKAEASRMTGPGRWTPGRVGAELDSPDTVLASGAFEALYGGAAGGGKTDAVIVGGCRHFAHPNYTGIIFRRTFPDLERFVVPRSKQIVPLVDPGADYNEQKHVWRFSAAGGSSSRTCSTRRTRLSHQGAEYQYEGWDELTHFTEFQYTYLLSRLRSAYGIPVRVRGGTNPGGPGHEWVFERSAPGSTRPARSEARPGETLLVREHAAARSTCREERRTPSAASSCRPCWPTTRRCAGTTRSTLAPPGAGPDHAGAAPRRRLAHQAVFRALLQAGLVRDHRRGPGRGQADSLLGSGGTKPSKESPDPDWTRGGKLALARARPSHR